MKSFAMLLGPDNTLAALKRRHASLGQALETIDAELARHSAFLPRVVLLETEYQRAITAAELAWLEQIISDLQTGAASWSQADFASSTAAYTLDDKPRAKDVREQQ
jgi:hypothetical protein